MSLLSASYGWIPDVVFLTILLGGLIAGTIFGFVRGICKIAGTVLSLIFAAFFCTPFTGALEELFGLVSKFGSAIGSNAAAYWLCVIGSFIALTTLVRVAIFFLEKLGKSIVDNSSALTNADRLLGSILGFTEAILVVMMIMTILKWMHIDALDTFIAETKVVGTIYFSGWFEWLASLPVRFIESSRNAISHIMAV